MLGAANCRPAEDNPFVLVSENNRLVVLREPYQAAVQYLYYANQLEPATRKREQAVVFQAACTIIGPQTPAVPPHDIVVVDPFAAHHYGHRVTWVQGVLSHTLVVLRRRRRHLDRIVAVALCWEIVAADLDRRRVRRRLLGEDDLLHHGHGEAPARAIGIYHAAGAQLLSYHSTLTVGVGHDGVHLADAEDLTLEVAGIHALAVHIENEGIELLKVLRGRPACQAPPPEGDKGKQEQADDAEAQPPVGPLATNFPTTITF